MAILLLLVRDGQSSKWKDGNDNKNVTFNFSSRRNVRENLRKRRKGTDREECYDFVEKPISTIISNKFEPFCRNYVSFVQSGRVFV